MGNTRSDSEVDTQTANEIMELARAKGALSFGEFGISAGGTSGYYFDGRHIFCETLDEPDSRVQFVRGA